VPSFGARLKQEREKQGVTLEDISLTTKIGTRMLQALEDEHFEQLPGGIFNKGFVRAYARYLGIDEQAAVADYLDAIGEGAVAQPLPNPEPEPEVADGVARLPWQWLALALLLIALGFAGVNFYSREKEHPQPVSHSTAATSSPAPAAPGSAPTSAPAAQASSTDRNPQQPANPDAAPAATPPASSQQTLTPAGAFVVVVKAREDSWISIAADGQRVMQDTLIASAEKNVSAQQQVVIRAGNVGALDFFFNGRKLPSQGDYGEVRTLTFDSNGVVPPPKTPPENLPQPN
jgi:cytoskeleton protein RodZ